MRERVIQQSIKIATLLLLLSVATVTIFGQEPAASTSPSSPPAVQNAPLPLPPSRLSEVEVLRIQNIKKDFEGPTRCMGDCLVLFTAKGLLAIQTLGPVGIK